MGVPAAASDPQGVTPAAARSVAHPRPGPDAESQAWVARLSCGAPEREAAIAELLALLLKAARFVLIRRRSRIPNFPREELDDLATEAAGEALLAVLARLDEYRGESRFTTWAWKFAFFEASAAVRRRTWMGREIPSEDAGWSAFARDGSPEAAIEQGELFAALRCGIECVLTAHQRTVFVALALNDVPVDVLAERMQTTRGALYKTLHEARGRLRAHLAEATRPSSRRWGARPVEAKS
jgi:RNA polymerase sigma-70 factor (ECF subfamily)